MKNDPITKLGEILKPTEPIITLENGEIDYYKHPIVVIGNGDTTSLVFHMRSNINQGSVLDRMINYKVTPGENIMYNAQIVQMSTFIKTDIIHSLINDDIFKCQRFFAYLTPGSEDTLQNIIASNYFFYNFLVLNDVIERNELNENLKNYYFLNNDSLFNNNRYRDSIIELLDKDIYDTFVDEINDTYNTSIDRDVSYYNYLQFVKKSYSIKISLDDENEERHRRVA